MIKAGTAAYTFPLGRNGHYKPLTISAPATTATFKAEYSNKNPADVHSFSSKDSSLNRISTNEYWMLERTSGTANVTATFSIDNMGCQFDSLSHLKVAAWNGSQWKDKGNGGTTGNTNEGTISTSGASSTYGMFTLGTSDTLRCVPCRANAGDDTTSTRYNLLILGNDEFFNTNVSWSPSDRLSNSFLPYVNLSAFESEIFTKQVVNSIGCIAVDYVYVIVNIGSFKELTMPCISYE